MLPSSYKLDQNQLTTSVRIPIIGLSPSKCQKYIEDLDLRVRQVKVVDEFDTTFGNLEESIISPIERHVTTMDSEFLGSLKSEVNSKEELDFGQSVGRNVGLDERRARKNVHQAAEILLEMSKAAVDTAESTLIKAERDNTIYNQSISGNADSILSSAASSTPGRPPAKFRKITPADFVSVSSWQIYFWGVIFLSLVILITIIFLKDSAPFPPCGPRVTAPSSGNRFLVRLDITSESFDECARNLPVEERWSADSVIDNNVSETFEKQSVEYSCEEYVSMEQTEVREIDVDCFYMENKKTKQKCTLEGRLLTCKLIIHFPIK